MKTLTLLSVILVSVTVGCETAPAQNNAYGNRQDSQAVLSENGNAYPNSNLAIQSQNPVNEKIVLHSVISSKTNTVTMQIPLPASWKLNNKAAEGEPSVTGPNKLAIYAYPAQSYMYTTIPEMYQAYQSTGTEMAQPVGIDNVISQKLIPYGKENGLQLIKHYPLPQIAAIDASYANSLHGNNASNTVNRAAGTDWTDKKGNKVLILLRYSETGNSDFINWGYSIQILRVGAESFDQAKNDYINGLANTQYNQNEINAFNNNLANEQQESDRHFQKMQKITTNGAKQRMANNVATTEYIRENNAALRDFRWKNEAVVQEQTGDYLSDQYRVVSPFDGQEYTVESGSETYWINNNGVYIKSDDVNFDPNRNEAYPGVWQVAPRKEY